MVTVRVSFFGSAICLFVRLFAVAFVLLRWLGLGSVALLSQVGSDNVSILTASVGCPRPQGGLLLTVVCWAGVLGSCFTGSAVVVWSMMAIVVVSCIACLYTVLVRVCMRMYCNIWPLFAVDSWWVSLTRRTAPCHALVIRK